VRGALSVARRLAASGRRKRDAISDLTLVLPPPNVAEASLVSKLAPSAPPTLTSIVAQLEAGRLDPPGAGLNDTSAAPVAESVDLADVVGQDVAKRALEIAAAGAHALLMIGPPGAGKTMLARRLPTILPALTEEEALEVVAIHSVAGLLAPNAAVSVARPFRAPIAAVGQRMREGALSRRIDGNRGQFSGDKPRRPFHRADRRVRFGKDVNHRVPSPPE